MCKSSRSACRRHQNFAPKIPFARRALMHSKLPARNARQPSGFSFKTAQIAPLARIAYAATSPATPSAVTTENMKITGNRFGGTPDFAAVHTATATKLAAPTVAIIA